MKGRPVKDFRNAVKSAGNKQTIGGGVVEHSLWFGQIGNRVDSLAGFQINYFERVVIDGSHKEALALHVDA
ncbi:MAG TPA: hypothetical protein VGL34_06560 [Steroidobacteraceae bacterium]